MTTATQLPIPTHFDPSRVGELWRVPYQERAAQAKQWAKMPTRFPLLRKTNAASA
jgi:hypothetical protein